MSDDKKKTPEVLHMKIFDGGRRTPDEVHRSLAFGKKKCTGCGSDKPAIRIKVLVTKSDCLKFMPQLAATLVAMNKEGPYLPTVETKYGPIVMISDVVACDHCKSDLERAAAKGPSWAIVEIDRMGLAATHKTVIQSLGV